MLAGRLARVNRFRCATYGRLLNRLYEALIPVKVVTWGTVESVQPPMLWARNCAGSLTSGCPAGPPLRAEAVECLLGLALRGDGLAGLDTGVLEVLACSCQALLRVGQTKLGVGQISLGQR